MKPDAQFVFADAQIFFDRKAMGDIHVFRMGDWLTVQEDVSHCVQPFGHELNGIFCYKVVRNVKLCSVKPFHFINPLHLPFIISVKRIFQQAVCHQIGMDCAGYRRRQPFPDRECICRNSG